MAQESLEERGRQTTHFFALQREQLRSQISFELELSSEESDDDIASPRNAWGVNPPNTRKRHFLRSLLRSPL
eukprot:SAG11_NODE_15780_length_566_cov_3.993576_1_plen_72_part_00